MKRLIQNVSAITFMAAGLTACGNDSATPAPPVVVPAPAPRIEDGFGANFGAAYRANPNTDAMDPMADDIIPLDLTKDAVII